MRERETLSPIDRAIEEARMEVGKLANLPPGEKEKAINAIFTSWIDKFSNVPEPDPRNLDKLVTAYAEARGVDLEEETEAGPEDASYRRVAGSYEGGKKR